MKKVDIWEDIVKEFGFTAPTKGEKKGFADILMPLENDFLIIEEKEVNDFELPEGITTQNLLETENIEKHNELMKNWDIFYRDVIQEGVTRLNFTEKNIETEKKRVHKILILRGIDETSKDYYSSNFGGLLYNMGIKEGPNGNTKIDFGVDMEMFNNNTNDSLRLFAYGLEVSNVHIITEQQLNFITSYIPTLQGLLDYLSWKEHLLSTINVMSVDEYSLLLIYLLEIFKGKRQESIFVPFEDKIVVDFVESELSKDLLNQSMIFQEFLGLVRGNSEFLQYYLLFSFKTLLMFVEQFYDLIHIDYTKHSSKTFMLYQGTDLYIFHNVDNKLVNDKFRTIYGSHFVSKVALKYLDELKGDIDIKNIVCCIINLDEEEKLNSTFISIKVEDLEDEKNYGEIRNFVEEGDKIGWLPQSISLEQLVEQRVNEVRELIPKQKGSDRNKLCPCGSGKKYKKCCGKYK